MVQTDFGGEGGVKKASGRNWQRILLPVVGLLLIIGAIIFAYFLSQPLANFFGPKVLHVAGSTKGIREGAGFAIFIIFMLVYAALYAAIAPKPPKGISEMELDKEKRAKAEEDMRMKQRKRDMKNKMRQARKNQNQ